MDGIVPVHLNCGCWHADILPSFGANLIKLSYNGYDILRSPANMQELKSSPYLFGSPLLFPANRVPDGKFSFDGCKYQLPINEPKCHNHIHGLLYNAPFKVINKSITTLQCVLTNEAKYYPFPFVLTSTFILSEGGITQRWIVLNTGVAAMPISLAFHTTFVAPVQFQVPVDKRYEWDNRFLPTGSMLALNEVERRFLHGAPSEGQTISGYYTSAGATAQIGDFCYQVSSAFDHWTLFNGGGTRGFLCIEPQVGPVNSINSDSIIRLMPKKTMIFETFIGRN